MNAVLEKIELLRSVAVDDVGLDRMLGKLLHVVQGQHHEKLMHLDDLLRRFETRYQMDSQTFQREFDAGRLGDAMDFFEWYGLIEMRKLVHQKFDRLAPHFVLAYIY
jgi:hypothetical protein